MSNKIISLFKKIFSKDDSSSEEFDSYIAEYLSRPRFPNSLDNSDEYPISQYKAFQIANLSQNLKTDFCKIMCEDFSDLYFTNGNVNLKEYENEKYWEIQITDAEFSTIEYQDNSPVFVDGTLLDDDYKKLRCLINVNTEKYIYYPQK